MKTINQILDEVPTPWTGSNRSYEEVRDQIAERFGDEAAEEYDASKNCRTFSGWLKVGYQVKKGQKALRSVTFVDKLDPNTGEVIGKVRRVCFLFFVSQVEKIKSH